jgi:hypothetical protein
VELSRATRRLSAICLAPCLAIAFAAVAWATPDAPAAAGSDAALVHARELLARVAFVDGHNDLPWTIREEAASDIVAYDLRARRATQSRRACARASSAVTGASGSSGLTTRREPSSSRSSSRAA